MILDVDFISRARAESLQPHSDLVVISITEPEADVARLAIPEDRVLRLVFHDVDPGNQVENRWKLFDDQHAKEVINFVRQLHADQRSYKLAVHCRAGISRSAAIALFVAEETGCHFRRKPFSGLANRHLLSVLGKASGHQITAPKALPKREHFEVSISRNFETGQVAVTVENLRNHKQVTLAGDMLQAIQLAATGIEEAQGVDNPPPSYHVSDWDSLET